MTGQKFYRPELTFNENEEYLEPIETRRLLYYSFDQCEFPADIGIYIELLILLQDD